MSELAVFAMLFFSGIAAGISNAIAGGGTFFTLPVFLAIGIPPVVANASNAVAVWPGHAMAAFAYRKELSLASKALLWPSLFLVLTGSIIGAYLLSIINNDAFTRLIPFLILFATVLFAFGKGLLDYIKRKQQISSSTSPFVKSFSELLLAVYGGFFIAAYGVMLMAWLQMTNDNNIQTNNALKNLIATVVSSVAVIIFIVFGLVSWQHTGITFLGAIVGGLLGSRIAKCLSPLWFRRVIISFGLFLSLYYFAQYYVSY